MMEFKYFVSNREVPLCEFVETFENDIILEYGEYENCFIRMGAGEYIYGHTYIFRVVKMDVRS